MTVSERVDHLQCSDHSGVPFYSCAPMSHSSVQVSESTINSTTE